MASKMTKDRPKTALRRSCVGSFFASIFVFDFGPFWGRFWLPFGTLLGAQIGHFWHRFFDDFGMSFQERPKSGQERPRAAQEWPRAAPERPKSGQKRPKSGPRATKSCQKWHKIGPKWMIFRSVDWILLLFLNIIFWNR